MKLSIKKDEILKGLQRIQGVVDKKNTMPILANMLLLADGKGVEIVATDLEIGLRGRYAAEVTRRRTRPFTSHPDSTKATAR